MTKLAAITATAIALALPALAAAEKTLTGDEIRATVSDATVQGAMDASGAYTEFYAADGTIRGSDYTGAWSVEGDTMCFDYGEGPDCWSVGLTGDQVRWIKDGAVLGTGTRLDGNPNGF